MSIFKFFLPLVILLALGCSETSNTDNSTIPNTATTSELGEITLDPNAPATPPKPPAEPAQNAAGVWHYTCSKGCAGGGGSATPCANCGETLVHNAAYHTPAGNTGNPTISTGNPAANPTITPPAPGPEPAQNAAGVWHYTCAKGCAGGAGAAGSCASCGGALAHNAAYHN